MTEASARSPSEKQASSSDQIGTMLWSKENGIGNLVFNNVAKHNAVSLSMWKETTEILDQFARDQDVRVVVLSGAGNKAFVSGADVSKFESERSSQEAVDAYTTVINGVYDMIYRFDKPVIAKIRGYCLGGGCHLALACDFRFADRTALVGIPAAKLSIVYGVRSVQRLLALTGIANAKRILYSGDRYDAERTNAIGLVDEIHDDAELAARQYLANFAMNGPLSIAGAKFMLNGLSMGAGALDLTMAQKLIDAASDSEDYKEGRRAFAEKRPPRFRGV